MRRAVSVGIVLIVAAAAAALAWQWRERFFAGAAAASTPPARVLDRVGWLGSPGPLSAGHAALSNDCGACHVPFRPVADAKCLTCHARNTALLTRQDTAFHAGVKRCVACHAEHQGRAARISRMEHGVLDPEVTCVRCHVDRHQGVLGDRCTECHGVETWRIAGFRHPSAGSRLCAECHQPPASHLMMHFEMVDRTITGQTDAVVGQCWRCHTTDHWNNIKNLGFYEHH